MTYYVHIVKRKPLRFSSVHMLGAQFPRVFSQNAYPYRGVGTTGGGDLSVAPIAFGPFHFCNLKEVDNVQVSSRCVEIFHE